MISNKTRFFNLSVIIILIVVLSTAIFAQSEIPVINSDAAVLIDANTGQVLFEKNMNKKEYPASITKVMTGMLALENCSLDEIITMTREAVFSVERDSSHIALDVGEQIPMRYALYALAIKSANDAANGIGVHISGSLEAFADLMNKRAKELGALNTHFVTANGLHNQEHYTTAYDMALIMKEAIKTPKFLEFFNQKSYEIPPTNMQEKIRILHNKNSLLTGRLRYEGLIASKTGWTTEAKHTLVTAAKRGERVLIVVTLNSSDSQDKYNETMKLFDYGFNEFKEISISKNQLLNSLKEDSDFNSIKEFIGQDNLEIKRLINKELSVDDIYLYSKIEENSERNAKTLKILLNLNKGSELMYPDMGSYRIERALNRMKFELVSHSSITNKKIFSVILKIFVYLSSFLGIFILSKVIIIKYLKYKTDKNY